MIKNVLCAVDVNNPDEDRTVLEMAARLAKLDDAQLDVIAVVPDFGASVVGRYFQDHHVVTARDTAGDVLGEFVADVLGEDVNAKTRHIVAVGSVYEEVLKAAKLGEADLIVIGAHRPDLKDYLIGPNASRVVRHASCSVYVVR
ncbi:MAG: universal stress protein [Litoreibacter sp.]|nr:universal stress protein [Litoreibacter sp.]